MTRSTRILAALRVAPLIAIFLGILAVPTISEASKLSWLDEVVQQAVKEAGVGTREAAQAEARAGGRLLLKGADESLETIVRRSDDMARAVGKNLDQPAETALRARFTRVVAAEPELVRTFDALGPAEKRLVVEMSEAAGQLARKYPGQAETMIRALGVDGLNAVRIYGDDVAEVVVREGAESLNVLRKTGRAGWSFFTDTVLPNKGKLAAAGVLGLFLANPEKFVDTAGRATQYAVEQFAKAGIQLAGAVGDGAMKGLGSAISSRLASYGIHSEAARVLGMVLAVLVALAALIVLVGMPIRTFVRSITFPFRLLARPFLRARSPRSVS